MAKGTFWGYLPQKIQVPPEDGPRVFLDPLGLQFRPFQESFFLENLQKPREAAGD